MKIFMYIVLNLNMHRETMYDLLHSSTYMNTVKKRLFSSDMILCLISAILRKIVLHSYKSVRPNDFAFYYLSIWIVSSHFQVAPLPRNPNGNGKLESNMLSSIAAAF